MLWLLYQVEKAHYYNKLTPLDSILPMLKEYIIMCFKYAFTMDLNNADNRRAAEILLKGVVYYGREQVHIEKHVQRAIEAIMDVETNLKDEQYQEMLSLFMSLTHKYANNNLDSKSKEFLQDITKQLPKAVNSGMSGTHARLNSMSGRGRQSYSNSKVKNKKYI